MTIIMPKNTTVITSMAMLPFLTGVATALAGQSSDDQVILQEALRQEESEQIEHLTRSLHEMVEDAKPSHDRRLAAMRLLAPLYLLMDLQQVGGNDPLSILRFDFDSSLAVAQCDPKVQKQLDHSFRWTERPFSARVRSSNHGATGDFLGSSVVYTIQCESDRGQIDLDWQFPASAWHAQLPWTVQQASWNPESIHAERTIPMSPLPTWDQYGLTDLALLMEPIAQVYSEMAVIPGSSTKPGEWEIRSLDGTLLRTLRAHVANDALRHIEIQQQPTPLHITGFVAEATIETKGPNGETTEEFNRYQINTNRMLYPNGIMVSIDFRHVPGVGDLPSLIRITAEDGLIFDAEFLEFSVIDDEGQPRKMFGRKLETEPFVNARKEFQDGLSRLGEVPDPEATNALLQTYVDRFRMLSIDAGLPPNSTLRAAEVTAANLVGGHVASVRAAREPALKATMDSAYVNAVRTTPFKVALAEFARQLKQGRVRLAERTFSGITR